MNNELFNDYVEISERGYYEWRDKQNISGNIRAFDEIFLDCYRNGFADGVSFEQYNEYKLIRKLQNNYQNQLKIQMFFGLATGFCLGIFGVLFFGR